MLPWTRHERRLADARRLQRRPGHAGDQAHLELLVARGGSRRARRSDGVGRLPLVGRPHRQVRDAVLDELRPAHLEAERRVEPGAARSARPARTSRRRRSAERGRMSARRPGRGRGRRGDHHPADPRGRRRRRGPAGSRRSDVAVVQHHVAGAPARGRGRRGRGRGRPARPRTRPGAAATRRTPSARRGRRSASVADHVTQEGHGPVEGAPRLGHERQDREDVDQVGLLDVGQVPARPPRRGRRAGGSRARACRGCRRTSAPAAGPARSASAGLTSGRPRSSAEPAHQAA